jgi:hypothetical protein
MIDRRNPFFVLPRAPSRGANYERVYVARSCYPFEYIVERHCVQSLWQQHVRTSLVVPYAGAWCRVDAPTNLTRRTRPTRLANDATVSLRTYPAEELDRTTAHTSRLVRGYRAVRFTGDGICGATMAT